MEFNNELMYDLLEIGRFSTRHRNVNMKFYTDCLQKEIRRGIERKKQRERGVYIKKVIVKDEIYEEINISTHLQNGVFRHVYNKLWADGFSFHFGLLHFYMGLRPDIPDNVLQKLLTSNTEQDVLAMEDNHQHNYKHFVKNGRGNEVEPHFRYETMVIALKNYDGTLLCDMSCLFATSINDLFETT